MKISCRIEAEREVWLYVKHSFINILRIWRSNECVSGVYAVNSPEH